jgi:SAM-dependent methyltransferase
MGSGIIQGELWGRNPKDWASILEPTGGKGYEYALDFLKISTEDKLLDIGCGSGLFSSLAYESGCSVTGIDASNSLIEQAKIRNSSIIFLTGEMEQLPFADESFSIVCGFNSFQYAANIKNALVEAGRVLKANGKLVVMIWGNKEDCEAIAYFKAVGALLPEPLPGAPGPFALSENRLMEKVLDETGFNIINNTDIPSVWDFPDTKIALKGLMSSGPVARAIEISSFEKVHEAIERAIKLNIQHNGHVVYKNKFRLVISEKLKIMQ